MWGEIAAQSVPPTPATLRGRVATALRVADPAPARRMLRPFLIGGALFAGAALAALVVWQREPPSATVRASPLDESTAVRSEVGAAPLPAAAATVTSGPAQAAPGAVAHTDGGIPDPHTIVVVRRHEVAADAAAIALADRCHDGVLTELRALGGLNIVTDAAVFTRSTFEDQIRLPDRDRRIARGHGAGRMLVVATTGGCSVSLFDTATGALVQGAGGSGVDPQGERAENFSKGMARKVHQVSLVDRATEVAQARATLLDATLSERDRVLALAMLSQGRTSHLSTSEARDLLDKEVIAAAVQIAAKSADTEVRERVWVALRSSEDPALVQPLLAALTTDPDRTIRMQAAYTVRKFLGTPGVREALLKVAAEDPDSQPTVACCIETVREAAERASVPNAEFRGWVRRKLMDENLPTRSRLFALAPFTMDGRFVGSVSDIGADAAAVVFAIGRREHDPQMRRMAWDVLDRATPDKEFVPVLLGDLRAHSDEYVRAAAAKVLSRHVDDPDVREALDRAREDTSMEVRRVATSVAAAPVQ